MAETVDEGADAQLPVACTLGADDGPGRLRRWQHLHHANPPTAQLANGILEVRYPPGSQVLAELNALVAAERVCCAFVTWAVVEEDGRLVLRVTAPPGSPEDVEPVAAVFTASL